MSEGYSIKEIVTETRDDVKELRKTVDSLPTAAQMHDHERRIRQVEKRVWALPAAALATAGTIVVALIQSGVV